MKPDNIYCARCGVKLDVKGNYFDSYPEVCPECGVEFDRMHIAKVAVCGLFPGGGQIVNGDILKCMGVIILTFIAFMMGLALFTACAFIFSSIVVMFASLAANERAIRYAGYSKTPPPIVRHWGFYHSPLSP